MQPLCEGRRAGMDHRGAPDGVLPASGGLRVAVGRASATGCGAASVVCSNRRSCAAEAVMRAWTAQDKGESTCLRLRLQARANLPPLQPVSCLGKTLSVLMRELIAALMEAT
jgi:hypothetical protein